mgnify:FL=1
MRKVWTNKEVLEIREDFKRMTVREITEKYSITLNQANYAVYGYKMKTYTFWEKMKAFLFPQK